MHSTSCLAVTSCFLWLGIFSSFWYDSYWFIGVVEYSQVFVEFGVEEKQTNEKKESDKSAAEFVRLR